MTHPEDDRVFVACASSNGVWVIDSGRGVVTETIYTSPFPASPEGSTPDALSISPDGETLFVANADNNCVAMVDIEEPNKSAIEGFIPTGWYPTSLAVTPDGQNLLIGIGRVFSQRESILQRRGFESQEAGSLARLTAYPYIGTTMSGAITILPIPTMLS